MNLTNILNLPAPLVAAVANDPYDDGGSDISVTRLISPPRQVALLKGQGDILTEDVADRIYSVIGQSVHSLLERVPDDPSIVMREERMSTEVMGWKVSGQVDLVHREGEEIILDDWKVMSIWEGMNGIRGEKVQQLNLLAALLRTVGIYPNHVRIVALYRDWSKTKAAFGHHPARQVEIHEAPLWPEEEANAFFRDRVAAHQRAREILPHCTPEERWERPTTYAVMKQGRKNALRVVESEAEAVEWMVWKGLVEEGAELPKGYRIEVRPGRAVRCEDYCAAAPICTQWQEMQNAE